MLEPGFVVCCSSLRISLPFLCLTISRSWALRAPVGAFGEEWCNQPQTSREGVLGDTTKSTTPVNAFPLLFAAKLALVKLDPAISPWTDTVRDMVLQARKIIDEVITKETKACSNFQRRRMGRYT